MLSRMLRSRGPVHLLTGLLLAAALAPATAGAHGAAGDPPADDRARGMEHAGLVRSTDPHCRGLYAGAQSGVCTHGPDPAPAGVDVTQRRSTAEIVATTAPSVSGTTPGTSTPPTDGTGAVVCEGDGVSGKRIQTLYVVASDKTDRFDAVKDTLGQNAVNADRQYNGSAQQNGAARHLRFVTASDGLGGCVLDLRKVVVATTADDTFDATITAVKAQGYNRTDRKYMLWVDANVYCGIGSVYRDSQAGQTNLNNGSYAQYGRSDNGCWNYAEAHELMHNLGGVQPDAPNATPNFHCSDEYDEMCYDDDGSGPVVMRQICPSSVGKLFDCNDDDYFNAGSVPTGTYLASHWNTATSAFLINPTVPPADTTPPAVPVGVAATGGPGTITVTWTAGDEPDLAGYRVLRNGTEVATLGKVTTWTDSGLAGGTTNSYAVRAVDTAGNVSASSAPASATAQASTVTDAISGAFSRKTLSASLARAALAGPSRVVASGSSTSKGKTSPASVTVKLVGPGGQVLVNQSGSAVDVSVSLPSNGSYTWTVSGASGVKYALSATYQR